MPDNKHLTDVNFASLGLAPSLLQGLEAMDFNYCTPIQARTLPIALAGQDVTGQAQTGTGKTAAFLLTVMHRLLTHPASPERTTAQPRALVLAPTRELAVQIHADAQALGRYSGLVTGLVYGGEGYNKQRKQAEDGVDILIATPGRLLDYIKQKVFDLRRLEVFVLDEADRMFDLGFIRDIRYFFRCMPPREQRLTLLFSATLSWRVGELAYEYLNNPQHVSVETEKVTAANVRERLYHVASEEKIPLLLGLLKQQAIECAIIFVNTKRSAERVCQHLQSNGFENAGLLSGDVPQRKRMKLLAGLQNGSVPILVATDVAARGLHIPSVSHVINFDLPQDPEDYVHRIGRTARAGASGDAISFACEAYVYSLADIEHFIGHIIETSAIDETMLMKPVPSKNSGSHSCRRKPTGTEAAGRTNQSARSGNRRRRSHREQAPKPPTSGST